eukprot:403363692
MLIPTNTMKFKSKWNILTFFTLALYILNLIGSTNASTQAWSSSGLISEVLANLGSDVGLSGYEFNFWMRPKINTVNALSQPFLKLLNAIEVSYSYTGSVTPANSIQIKYGGKTQIGYFPVADGNTWMNINARVYFTTYIMVNGWYGNQIVDSNPTFTTFQQYPNLFLNLTASFLQTSSQLYVHLAEFRVFELDPNFSWGQYFKHYNGIWPNSNTFYNQRQYVRATGNLIYQDLINLNLNMSIGSDAIAFPVTRCDYGFKLKSDGTCVACSQTNCSICPAAKTDYSGLCRVCNTSAVNSTCVAITIDCPLDYYNSNGICYRCPVGCSECSSGKNCSKCDSGLQLVSNLTAQVCACPNGQFGTPNFSTDVLTCTACSASCKTCDYLNTNCTSCDSPNFLYDNTCVADCTIQTKKSYANVTDRTCYQCGKNCLACTNATTCTNCINDGTTITYNYNGVCVTSCPSDSLLDTPTMKCNQCANNCSACAIATTNCTLCQSGYVLDINKCIDACPLGKYADPSFTCQNCPTQCIACQSATYCTICKPSFYFVNYQCQAACPSKFFPDPTQGVANLFCRNCPSGCALCTSEKLCSTCDTGLYLDSYQGGATQLCVPTCQPGKYPATNTCNNCKTNCQQCTTGTDCQKCYSGYVLNQALSTCVATCPSTTYADANDICQNCISNCQTCSNKFTCDACANTYYVLEGPKTCVNACPQGTYLNSATSTCSLCKPECRICTGANTCSSCMIGYDLQGSTCVKRCGNSVRQDLEQCDDGNQVSGDGCSSTCQLEQNYVCMPLVDTSTGPDKCYCDANFDSAQWKDYWGQIELYFLSELQFQSNTVEKSSDPSVFCDQILLASITAQLGTNYQCFLISDATQSILRINLDKNSNLGNSNYETIIEFLPDVLFVSNCNKGIPVKYSVNNLPIETPSVSFQTSMNTLTVPSCSNSFYLNIFSSKGFTKRNTIIAWTISSMIPADLTLQNSIQTNILNGFQNMKYVELTQSTIESLQGKQVNIKAAVTNFLNIQNSNTTTLTFSSIKILNINDLQDIYNMQTDVSNTLYPRIRIPYCSSETGYSQVNDLKNVTVSCTLIKASDTNIQTALKNCTIPKYNMTLGEAYKLRVQAVTTINPTMSATKIVHINTDSPDVQISFIEGCDRLFSVNASIDLEVHFNTNTTFATYTWYCTDTSTGSPCFTTSYDYISVSNTKKVSIISGILFPSNTYIFEVRVKDSQSNTQASMKCNMYSAPIDTQVLDVRFLAETNKNGYIDFSPDLAAFKVKIINSDKINKNSITYLWKVSDSSGYALNNNLLEIFKNSLGIPTTLMERNNIYTIEANISSNNYQGYIKIDYLTEPDLSFEFSVEPATGVAHETVFMISVTSQSTFDGLQTYVFGYVNPVDQESLIPLFQRSFNRYIKSQLPYPNIPSGILTCYVTILLPNGVGKTYFQDVQLSPPTLSVSVFKTQYQNAVMDDLIESMQIKNKLETLSSQLSVAEKSAAIKKILQGLTGETTPLSDYYIQTSTASLLEYISTQSDSLLADGTLVTQAAAIFNQITITENNQIDQGKFLQFARAATVSLFNFGNNIFKRDFSAQIGQNAQKEMKTTLMKGLKNILKGSLSNQILGDMGGFSYTGQNIYAKAVKFDSLETNFMVTAYLPTSISGTLSQNYVGIALPSATSSSNPCKGLDACQISVIILDQPVNTFISNSKESQLKSIFVDLSIQSTEIASPNSYVAITDIQVKGLIEPISITVPLTTLLDTTNPNKTLGCGYLDETDQLFKSDGMSIKVVSSSVVTCLAKHLTAIGVEEYTSETTTDVDAGEDVVTEVPVSDDEKDQKQVNMWNSWAIYVSIVMLILMGVSSLWAYRKDKRDEVYQGKLRLDKDKLYLGVYLEPILIARKDKKDTEKLVTSTQQLDDRKKKQNQMPTQYEQLDNLNDTMRNSVIQPPPPQTLAPNADIGGNYLNPGGPFGYQQMPPPLSPSNNIMNGQSPGSEEMLGFGADMTGMSKKSTKKVMKKKKKKKNKPTNSNNGNDDNFDQTIGDFRQNGVFGNSKKYGGAQEQQDDAGADHNIFFEGGTQDIEIEFGMDFEGGSDEDFGAESIKSKRSKKKKKKRSTSSRRGSIGGKSDNDVFDDDAKSVKSGKSNKSNKSKGKKKKQASLGNNSQNASKNFPKVNQSLNDEDDIKFNSQLGGFQLGKQASHLFQEDPIDDISKNSRLSVKGKKKKKGKKGSRAGSRQSSRSSGADSEDDRNLNRPDFEAEVISSRKNKPMEMTNKSDLFKPVNSKKQSIDPTFDAQLEDKHRNVGIAETKGFDTLMQEPNGQKAPNLDGVTKVSTKKPTVKRAKSTIKPKRFQEEQAGCCVFFCWNCKESHRLFALLRHYNEYLSRPSRVLLIFMSFYMYIMITGFLIDGSQIVGKKETRGEQFICGLAAALISKFWIIIVANLMRHTKRSKVYEQQFDSIHARRLVKFNMIRYWLGVGLAAFTILLSIIFVFVISSQMIKARLEYWGWAFLFSLIGEFALVEGLVLAVQTVITLIVGAAPDSCGKCRNLWLETILQSIKDTVK